MKTNQYQQIQYNEKIETILFSITDPNINKNMKKDVQQ